MPNEYVKPHPAITKTTTKASGASILAAAILPKTAVSVLRVQASLLAADTVKMKWTDGVTTDKSILFNGALTAGQKATDVVEVRQISDAGNPLSYTFELVTGTDVDWFSVTELGGVII